MQSLDIPLTESPTRQKVWRVVVSAAPLLLAAAISMVLVRSYLALDTISSFAPQSSELTLRIIKTPQTSAALEDQFHGVLLFPNAPFTINELSGWSRRGSAVFMNETGIIGFAVAGRVPQNTIDEAKNLGFIVAGRFGGTFIGTEAPASTKFGLRLPVTSLPPWFNGEITSATDNAIAPFRLTTKSITITGMGRPTTTGDALIDQSLAKITISALEVQDLLNFDVPLIFPGVRAIQDQMLTHGLSFSLGQDDDGTPYAISIPDSDVSREDLESVVSELYYTNNLILRSYRDVHTSVDEIVSTAAITPVTTSDATANITSISDNTGVIVRAAQTAHGLVLTNRAADLDGSNLGSSTKNLCLRSANQWITPSKLLELLPGRLSTPDWTIFTKLQKSQQIAFSENKTRICW